MALATHFSLNGSGALPGRSRLNSRAPKFVEKSFELLRECRYHEHNEEGNLVESEICCRSRPRQVFIHLITEENETLWFCWWEWYNSEIQREYNGWGTLLLSSYSILFPRPLPFVLFVPPPFWQCGETGRDVYLFVPVMSCNYEVLLSILQLRNLLNTSRTSSAGSLWFK